MRKNKEKTVTSGDEDVVAPPLVQMASVQAGKRKSKTISSAVDLDDLLSRHGPKKQKSSKTSLGSQVYTSNSELGRTSSGRGARPNSPSRPE